MGKDEAEIEAWPYARLMRWQIYDEVNYMIQSVQRGAPKSSYESVVEKVRDEQERHDWCGVYRMGGAHTRKTESIDDKR